MIAEYLDSLRALNEAAYAAAKLARAMQDPDAIALRKMALEIDAMVDAAAPMTVPERAEAIAALKSWWGYICDAMNEGTWRGSEADALAEIERTKGEIAALEAAE